MSTRSPDELQSDLREQIREIVREEIAAALADAGEQAPEKLMTVREAIVFTRSSESTIRRHLKGGMPQRRLGRKILIDRRDLLAWVVDDTKKDTSLAPDLAAEIRRAGRGLIGGK